MSPRIATTTDVDREALLDFVRGGHGFIGSHSATDTLYDWPDYRDLIGAQFKEHPWTQTARVLVEDRVLAGEPDQGAQGEDAAAPPHGEHPTH